MVRDGVPVYRKTLNAREADAITVASARRSFGVVGTWARIGLWDSGQPFRHAEIEDRLTIAESSDFSNHATHVMGTLTAAGFDAEAMGMSPAAEVVSYDWTSDYLEMYREAEGGLRVSNHSYDYSVGWEPLKAEGGVAWVFNDRLWEFGEYIQWSYYWDWTMSLKPYYLMVKAAGNEGRQGPGNSAAAHYHSANAGDVYEDAHPVDCETGFSCLGPGASSKNALVVGALNDDAQSLASCSSTGPTLDGRIKPDVVAVGTDVYSTLGLDGYGYSSGTSMATPMVAGSVGLMLDLERRLYGDRPHFLSSTLKGLIIHTADDLGAVGPDYRHGWGRVDIAEAMHLLEDDFDASGVIVQQPVVEGTYSLEAFAFGGELKVTLVWTDHVGTHPNSIQDKTAPVLVHDFDLSVLVGGEEYYPFVLDPTQPSAAATTGRNTVDNVEQVLIPDAPAGPATLRVRAPEGLTAGTRVSLIVTGVMRETTSTIVAHEEVSPASAGVNLSIFPNPAPRGGTVHVRTHPDRRQVLEIQVFDMTDRLMSTLLDGASPAVVAELSLGVDWPSGMYVVRALGAGWQSAARLVVF